MYLKSIEVQGFKSFAQKINFEFHNGITGIVGPNGSGKSNVADAVRWVLGEQSAKQLRGGNMQDVIFSGTETRKPLSFACVAITLDNQDHQLPVEFNEVTVTRRLYRSGESEYLINGTACRLRDINEMFFDTGIGKEGYSIIGQGQIDRILSGKPEERRELFDEAAGIVKFKRRKNTAVKKLADEQANLLRLTDILGELSRQLGPLERQSRTARIYLEKKEQLKALEINQFILENEHNNMLLSELEGKLSLTEDELSRLREEYDRTKEEFDRLNKELEELNQKTDALREKAQDCALKRQQLIGQADVLKEQIQAGANTDEHYRNRLTVLEQEIHKREEEKASLSEERSVLKKQVREAEMALREQEERLASVQFGIADCEKAVEDGKNEIIELLNSRAATRGEAQRFDTLMEQIDIRKASISQKLLQLKSEEAELSKTKKEGEERFSRITGRIADLNGQIRSLEENVQTLTGEIASMNSQIEIGQRTLNREESRLESLKSITERYEGFQNAIRRVMEQKSAFPGIHGVVADLIQVEKDYEIAVETALGGSIQNIVTDTEETAKKMIAFLKKNKYGRATFLPLSSVEAKGDFPRKEALKEKGVIGIASSLVETEAEYEGLMRYLLGKVLVVDQMDNAIAIARKYHYSFRMVTIEGELFSPGGSMTGGTFRNNNNLLGRRREIDELEESVRLLKKDLDEAAKKLESKRTSRNEKRNQIAALLEELRKGSVEQNTAKIFLEQQDEKEKEIKERYERIRLDQTDVKQKLENLRTDHDRVSKELENSKRDEEELESFIDSRQEELDQLKEEESEAVRILGESRILSSSLQQKEEFASENLARLEAELRSLEEEQQELTLSLEKGKDEAGKKQEELESLKSAAEEFRILEEKDREEILALGKEREKKSGIYQEFFEKRDELSEQVALLDKEEFRLKSLKEKLVESQEERINYLWEEYEITPNHALQYKDPALTDRQRLKKDAAAVRAEIKKLGSVNVNAIEDYKELSERHTFLSGQYEDIKKAEKSLEDIIRELDEGMRKQFTEKFKDIQREFDSAFRELFGGGKGTLELSEEEDILEAGIRIISQPPGKKLQNMMQMSGGEKALTAIALLFAIQNLKPSPFCLLDEIEAALDDSNVGRFAGYLQKLTKNTQFIIITHRRGTMTAADRLYGITMQEKGVSALVSVDLVESQLSR